MSRALPCNSRPATSVFRAWLTELPLTSISPYRMSVVSRRALPPTSSDALSRLNEHPPLSCGRTLRDPSRRRQTSILVTLTRYFGARVLLIVAMMSDADGARSLRSHLGRGGQIERRGGRMLWSARRLSNSPLLHHMPRKGSGREQSHAAELGANSRARHGSADLLPSLRTRVVAAAPDEEGGLS